MGNHEYCDECGASDFHFGRECNPEEKAKHQKEQDEIKRRNQEFDNKVNAGIAELRRLGYQAEKNRWGDIEISRFSLTE